ANFHMRSCASFYTERSVFSTASIVAYLSKGADSKELFEDLKCEKNELFVENMNQYDTIFWDIQAQFVLAKKKRQDPNGYIDTILVQELRTEYPEIVSEEDTITEALANIYNETEGQFVIIFDEWDYPIRELEEGCQERADYIEFLRELFKNSDAKEYIRLAYLTGIMPIVRTKGQSAVNNYIEYTMTNSIDLAQDIGFTEGEVQSLCEKFGVDFDQMKKWYNGYNLNGIALISAFTYYHKPVREFPCGKGFGDIVYLPLSNHPNRPVIVVELKWDKSADAAISQIKKKQYPESLKGYAGEILLVGIDYNKKQRNTYVRLRVFVLNSFMKCNYSITQ
ncbi:MAG: ATP-binding protein, partial [Lachnospiraceae bacterium]|nr:ATP-binding protein [Lachnospiraceae bacterium]